MRPVLGEMRAVPKTAHEKGRGANVKAKTILSFQLQRASRWSALGPPSCSSAEVTGIHKRGIADRDLIWLLEKTVAMDSGRAAEV